MKNILFLFACIISISAFSQSKISDKNLAKYNYLEINAPNHNQAVDNYPMYPNGVNGIYADISNNFSYPAAAASDNIEGNVHVSFIVNEIGDIEDIQIEKSAHVSLDQEAMRIISNLKSWAPGYTNGEPVKWRYTIPLEFRLDRDLVASND
jgi:TonB family protein